MSHHLAGGVDWNNKKRFNNRFWNVTTLRVVWIEMQSRHCVCNNRWVTTLRVVWIEMQLIQFPPLSGLSPPCGWCGLKSQSVTVIKTETGHHPAGGVDWNFRAVPLYAGTGSPPCGWCGLKSDRGPFWFIREMVTTLRVVWIEIINKCPLLAMS